MNGGEQIRENGQMSADGRPRKLRRRRGRVSSFTAGLLALAVIALACYAVFGGGWPWDSSPYVLKAAFTSNTELHIPSEVRIAGVDVGQVVGVRPIPGSANAGLVIMDIDRDGLPIHRDATLQIRTRIFLEGNFYVELHPGTPESPTLPSDSTLPASQTSGPVQLDRVLSALNGSARNDLQTLLQGFGAAMNAKPAAGQDAGLDPSMRGLTGAQGLNQALRFSARAFETSAIVNQALLGLRPHDLSGAVLGSSRFLTGLAQSGSSLGGFVSSFERTMTAFASRSSALARTVSVLPSLLRQNQAADSALDASVVPTQAFARALTPSIRHLPATIDAALPWLSQATLLMDPHELGGLLVKLAPAVDETSRALSATRRLVTQATDLARCFSRQIIPAGNTVLQDPPLTSGERVYQELFQSAVGIAGAAGNFDGNGRYVRTSAGGGEYREQTPSIPGNGPFYGNFVLPPLGTRPAWPVKAPPIVGSVACFENPAPNLQAQKGTGP